jgi:hypothetical protein
MPKKKAKQESTVERAAKILGYASYSAFIDSPDSERRSSELERLVAWLDKSGPHHRP